MGYLKDFQTEIANRDFNKFMTLWEEYCTSDNVPAEELLNLIKLVRESDFNKPMGAYIETLVPLWRSIEDPEKSYAILKGIIDIQTTQTQELYDLALSKATEKHGKHPKFNDLIKIAALKTKDNFTGSLTSIDVLAHLEVGQFLYHSGGWGIGEIMELSHLREQVVLEFENLSGRKSLTFVHAMRLLTPVSKTHFLSRRFSNPDLLEKEARENPVQVIKLLLQDLGPKTAQEIKDEMADLVIPEAEFSKWWQNTRARLKKDLSVETPESLKGSFVLRSEEISYQDKLQKALAKKRKPIEIIQTLHSYSKEETGSLKKEDVKALFINTIKKVLAESLTPKDRLQALFLAQNTFPQEFSEKTDSILKQEKDLINLIEEIDILQYKKQALTWVRENHADWIDLFITAMKGSNNVLIREYLLKELLADKVGYTKLEEAVEELLNSPSKNPEWFFWSFSRSITTDKNELPLAEYKERWWESLLLLLSQIENASSYQELSKKIVNLILNDRYKLVRDLFKDSSYEFTREFLLLASKCHSIIDHDQKSLRALAAVHYPDLVGKNDEEKGPYILWTTDAGYQRTQNRIQEIAQVEMVDNAREIEAARALGDLRENSEYKFAKERRARLQGEMRRLSDDIKKARVISPLDITPNEVGVGSVVELKGPKGETLNYKILGPWDADAEGHVLSFQSKLAQAMLGKKEGETFKFKEENFKISKLKTIFD